MSHIEGRGTRGYMDPEYLGIGSIITKFDDYSMER